MKPTTAILAAATLLVAWVAMPSAADDVTDDAPAATPVRIAPGTPALQRTPKPGDSKAEAPEAANDAGKPSAKAGAIKTIQAADTRLRARTRVPGKASGAVRAQRGDLAAGPAVGAAVGAKKRRGSVSRTAIGKQSAASRSRTFGAALRKRSGSR